MPRTASRHTHTPDGDIVVAIDRFGYLPRARALASWAEASGRAAADRLAPSNSRPVSAEIVTGVVRVLDPALAIAAAIASFWFYLGPEHDALTGLYAFAVGMAVSLQIVVFHVSALYRFKGFGELFGQLRRLVLAWTLIFASLIVVGFFVKAGDLFSRGWLVIWFAIGLALLIGLRVVLRLLFRRWSRAGRVQRRAVIIGAGAEGARLLSALAETVGHDIGVVGFFDDRTDRVGDRLGTYRRLGRIDDVVPFVRSERIDLILVALPLDAEDRLLNIMQRLSVLPVDIRLGLPTSLRFPRPTYSFVGNVPMLNMLDKPMSDWGYLLKSLEDRVAAALVLALAAPLMALVALAIKLDSRGPVFFRQERYGFNNNLIRVFKFRTLYHDRRDQLAEKLVTRNDPRVTRVGAFLRRTSLDELPQLFNVLLGDMSLVGPRAHALRAKAGDDLYENVVAGYFARHRVKPGITGWAQVNGWRGETDTEEKIRRRIEHDLYYIENWSFWFDLRIIFMTPIEVLRTDHVY